MADLKLKQIDELQAQLSVVTPGDWVSAATPTMADLVAIAALRNAAPALIALARRAVEIEALAAQTETPPGKWPKWVHECREAEQADPQHINDFAGDPSRWLVCTGHALAAIRTGREVAAAALLRERERGDGLRKALEVEAQWHRSRIERGFSGHAIRLQTIDAALAGKGTP